MLLLAVALLLSPAEGAVAEGSRLRTLRRFPVPIDSMDAMVRLAPGGVTVLAETESSLLFACSREGHTLWQRRLPSSSLEPSSIVGFDVDEGGRVFALEASTGEVRVFEAKTGRPIGTVVVGSAYDNMILPTGSLAADGQGGFYVLAHRLATLPPGPIHHFDLTGRLLRSFGPSGERSRRTPDEVMFGPGWIGRGPQGLLYYRPGGTLVFHRFTPEGQELSPITPPITLARRAEQEPGDSVFGTQVLPDGKIVCEVVHRGAYTPGSVPGSMRTQVQPTLYLINADGSLHHSFKLPLVGEFGSFGAATGDGRLYFLTTKQKRRPGQTPELVEGVVEDSP